MGREIESRRGVCIVVVFYIKNKIIDTVRHRYAEIHIGTDTDTDR
jgi:hypothetical protein